MGRLTIRLDDHVHAALTEELKDWQKLRGPKFSLNNLCEEKLSTPFPPTQWTVNTGTLTTSSPVNYIYTVTSTPARTIQPGPEKKNARRRRKS